MPDDLDRLRVDKWLWAARFVKTRALASDAVKGGKVSVNGHTVKPSKEVQVGDRVEFTNGPVRTTVTVRGVSKHRRPAREATLLYEETAESQAARAVVAAQMRLAAPVVANTPGRPGRPTKRDRRRYEDATRTWSDR